MVVEDMTVIDLGRMAYEVAYRVQCGHVDEVIAARDAGRPIAGRVLLVEHDPVVTISRRPGAAEHLLATERVLADAGVAVARTDRGGDITYHGPGQLVVYPIIDLNRLNLRLHDYMRLLEGAVIDALDTFGVRGHRDPAATGVWVGTDRGDAKICAMGVRVRRWVTMHGLALNVTTNLDHFGLIVPCGLAGREVTSLRALLGGDCPTIEDVKESVVAALASRLERAKMNAEEAREKHRGTQSGRGRRDS